MQLHYLPWFRVPWFRVVKILFQSPLALLSGLLLCLVPVAAAAQSVAFAGAQTTLPASGLYQPNQVGLDSAGDVFISDPGNNRVLELPRTATGYGPQMTIPVTGPGGIALDSAGDLFVVSGGTNPSEVLELPRSGTGYGSQITLPFSGLNQPNQVAVDSAGDVFVADYGDSLAAELPKTGTGYGAQVTLPFTDLGSIDFPYVLRAIAVDSDKNVFLADYGNYVVLELPWTGTGYGTQVTLPFSGLSGPWGVALDSGGDVFVTNWASSSAVELQKTSTGYGPQVTLPFTGLSGPYGDAVDNDGDVFVVNNNFNSAPGSLVELQTISVNFGGANICAPGATTPAPCSQTLTLNFNVNADVTLGTPKVLSGGAPNLDFTLASGSTCTGAFSAGTTCTVNVTFAPLATGVRNGSVEITDSSGNVLATTLIYGFGQTPTTINFSQGFGQAQGELQFNGSASVAGTALELNNEGLHEASSAFYPSPVNVQAFTTDFAFQLTNPAADGFTFTIQNVGPGALGLDGGSLGYAGIGKSVAIKFDLFQNPGDPSNNSIGVFVDGAVPIRPTSIDLTGSGINLHNGDPINAHITYDGTTLILTLTDLVTRAMWSHPFVVNIPATVGGDTAYVGFTGATGSETSILQILTWSYQAGQPLYYPAGFSSGSTLSMNGSASVSGTALQLTTRESSEAGSAFYTTPVNIQAFTTNFSFKLTDPVADGFTFTIQNAGLTALGGIGGSLGYAGIGNSVAIKFDLFQNAGDPSNNSAGIFVDGALPIGPASIDLTGSGINLHSGDKMDANLTYDGTILTLTIIDLVTLASWSHPFVIDIPATVGGNAAYVGFTGATGGESATQQILRWTFE